MEYSENIWHLFAKGLNGEISPEEQDELDQLLRNDPGLAQQYELLGRIWIEHSQQLPDDIAASGAVSKIISRADSEYREPETEPEHVRRGRRVRRVLYPLVAMALLVMAFLFFRQESKVAGVTNELPEPLVTQKGSRSRYLLPDGTVVWMNAGSKLSMENDFTGATREVRLDGEAYFSVMKNHAKPFIVHTSGFNIKVLGTVFNVKAYADDKNIETTLLSGSVKVFREKETEDQAIRLEKNQKLVIARSGEITAAEKPGVPSHLQPAQFAIVPIDTTRTAEARFETAWLYSRLEFRGDDFETLAHRMERWYNIKVVFTDEEVKKLNFNGSFEKETPEQAFMALRAALPKFRYSIVNQEVMVGSSR